MKMHPSFLFRAVPNALLLLSLSGVSLAQSNRTPQDQWLLSSLPQSTASHRGSARYSRSNNAGPQAVTAPGQVLYAFQGGNDGAFPIGGLIFDSAGNLYGTTNYGGGGPCGVGDTTGCGMVFELSPSSNGSWVETVLYSFQGRSDGQYPMSGLIFDSSGNLYGTTNEGGITTCSSADGATSGCGTVFELSPGANGTWTKTILYAFQAVNNDGSGPSGLTFDKSGNLYGATKGGGNFGCDHDDSAPCGTIFELSPNVNGAWVETVLYRFGITPDGWSPNGNLVFDQSGNLYGTTSQGGAEICPGSGGCGTFFELSEGSGGWSEIVLYSFGATSPDGALPNGGLVFDNSGSLYGTAELGGAGLQCSGGGGCGTVFEFSPNASGGWTEATLYNFDLQGTSESTASYPQSGLVLDQSGNLYGTTTSMGGGTGCNGNGCGSVFQLSPPSGSSGWSETTLYTFQGGNDGNEPSSGMILDQAGHLYGETAYGGGGGCQPGTIYSGCGVVFEIIKEPFATFAPTILNFDSQDVGVASNPQTITLTNSGGLPLTGIAISITGSNSNLFSQNNNCPASLVSGANCSINVIFMPTVGGSASAAISVSDNATGSPQVVPLSGTGLAPVSFSPASVTFPGQYVGTAGLNQNVTLTNTGNTTLTITSVAASPSTDFSDLSACGNSVAPGNSCQIGVFFDPSASGTRSGTLTITDNAAVSPQVVALTGVGEDFSMSAAAPSQTVMPGQTASYSVSVSPEGGFGQTVQLSCTGAPSGSTCSVTPATATLSGSTAQTVTVSVTTGASVALLLPNWVLRSGSAYGLWLTLLGVFGIVALRTAPRRIRRGGLLIGLLLVCMLSLLMMPACGNNGTKGMQAGTYNLTVTGAFTSGTTNITHSTKLTLVVQ
jgi:hypothetical protein